MNVDRMRPLASAPGPFVSLYIDDARDTHDAAKQAAARWGALHRHLEDSGIAENVIRAIERAVLHSTPGTGRQGRAIIAGGEGVLINEHLGSAPSITVLRISDYPYLLPLLESGTSRPTYVFAAVDHLGADVLLHRNDRIVHQSVQGDGYPVHKPATAGWHGYGDMQRTTEEAVRMNARATADQITEMVDQSRAGLVFLCGEVRARTDVLSALPRRIAQCVVPLPGRSEGGRADERENADLIDREVARRRLDQTGAVLTRYEEELGRQSGLAAQGLSAVCRGLRDGAVDTLIVGELGGTTVVVGHDRTMVAPDADSLSELGEAQSRVALADEALPFVALSTDASVVRSVGDIAPTEGIAALLRYVPADARTTPSTRSQAT